MRGRKPDPDATRRGTAHHGAKPAELLPAEWSGALTSAQARLLPLPKGLPRTKALRSLWQTLLSEIARTELRAGDLPLVEDLMVAAYRRTQATLLVTKLGLLVKGPRGPVKNPMLKEERDWIATYDRLAQRLGLSVESRVRLRLMEITGSSMLATLAREAEQQASMTLAEVEVIDGQVTVED